MLIRSCKKIGEPLRYSRVKEEKKGQQMNRELAQKGIDAYVDAEFPLNIFKSWDVVMNFFSEVEQKTDEESQEMYDKLPDEVMLYRGILAKEKFDTQLGASWTTNEEVAKMFALRFSRLGGTPYIMKGEIDKENILYFTNARQESEAIINPDSMIWMDYEEL